MMTRLATVFTCMLGLLLSNALHAAEGAGWNYDDKAGTGPGYWSTLSKDYHLCQDGKLQSPIDINSAMLKKLTTLHFHYDALPSEIVSNDRTLEVIYKSGSSFTVAGHQYELLQLHFHTPSEHTIIGEDHPMEVHFVHKNAQGKLAVVAVFVKQGRANKMFSKLIELATKQPGSVKVSDSALKASQLLSFTRAENYVTYPGSLTTPPCAEGVRWYVLRDMLEFSAAQVEAFSRMVRGSNSRPEQPLNKRALFRDKD